MKRFLALFLSFLMILSLVACGNSGAVDLQKLKDTLSDLSDQMEPEVQDSLGKITPAEKEQKQEKEQEKEKKQG